MLTLALETSTATFAAALATEDDVIASRALAGVPPARAGPARAGRRAAGGRGPVVRRRHPDGRGRRPGQPDRGPHRVAYGNGLAFALGAGVATAELAGADGRAGRARPCRCCACATPAPAGRTRAGSPAAPATYRHGPLAEVVRMVSGPEVVVAGDFRAEVAELLPGVLVKDSGITGPDVRVLRWVTAGRPTIDPTRERRRDAAHGAVPAVRRDR